MKRGHGKRQTRGLNASSSTIVCRVTAKEGSAPAQGGSCDGVVAAEGAGRLRAARDQAMTNVSAIAVETAQAIVERLTGDKVTKTAVKAALAGTK